MKTNCRVTTYNRESKMAPSRGAGPQASPPMSSGPVRGAQSGDGVSISSEAKEAEPDRLPVCLGALAGETLTDARGAGKCVPPSQVSDERLREEIGSRSPEEWGSIVDGAKDAVIGHAKSLMDNVNNLGPSEASYRNEQELGEAEGHSRVINTVQDLLVNDLLVKCEDESK